MKIKKIFLIFLIVLIAFTTYVQAENPEITATAGVVIDCQDGKFLYEKNINEKLYPASLTKMLTAIVVVENSNLQDEVTISQSAISNVEFGYVTSNIKPGEIFTVEQLLNLLLISSCNDIANALAEYIGGSMEGFAVMMNTKAKEIGCTNSNFVNPNGTHDSNHYSTVHDMALIGKYAMQYDEIKSIINKTQYELEATNENRQYYTTNEMLLSWNSNYYKYAKGGKTGFTTPAGYCMMTYAEKNDMPLIAIVMKSTTADSRCSDSKTILEYAYSNNTIRKIADEGNTIQTLTIKKGTADTKQLNAILDKTITAVVKNENVSTNIERNIEIYENLKAPIQKGEVVGTVTYEIEGKEYKGTLLAEHAVKKSKKSLVFVLIFICLILIIGGLRILSIRKRNKVLKRIRHI